ncbi:MAG: hypothetical protein QM775_25080 [Pirellulales bacterium]
MLDVRLTGGAPADGLGAALVVPVAHPLLAGHFPGAPLVPGVLLLDAARRAWELADGRAAAIAAVPEARWHAAVAPGVEVWLRAAVAPCAEGVCVTGEWAGPAGRVATFALVLRPGAPAAHRAPPRP